MPTRTSDEPVGQTRIENEDGGIFMVLGGPELQVIKVYILNSLSQYITDSDIEYRLTARQTGRQTDIQTGLSVAMSSTNIQF
jgi:hypothetical protein